MYSIFPFQKSVEVWFLPPTQITSVTVNIQTKKLSLPKVLLWGKTCQANLTSVGYSEF